MEKKRISFKRLSQYAYDNLQEKDPNCIYFTIDSNKIYQDGKSYGFSEEVERELNNKANKDELFTHKDNINNPHNVNKTQIGLGQVDNTPDMAKPISIAQGLGITQAIQDHLAIENPHNITAAMIGLNQVDNTSDIHKPISTATQEGLDLKEDLNNKITGWSSTPQDVKYPSERLVKLDLDKKVNISDIINNLLSDDGGKPLSAEQGKILKALIDGLASSKEDTIILDNEPTHNSINYINSGVIFAALAEKAEASETGQSIDEMYSDLDGKITNLDTIKLDKTEAESLYIPKTDIVDNLTDGGTNVPLSAEQGRIISARIAAVSKIGINRGAVVNAFTSGSNIYRATSGSIEEMGRGYSVHDILYYPGIIDIVIKVVEIDDMGGVELFDFLNYGALESQPSSFDFIGGSGSGFAATLELENRPATTLEDISNPVLNDFVSVLTDETRGGVGFVWIYSDLGSTMGWSRSHQINPNLRDFIEEPIHTAELATGSITKVKIVPHAVDRDIVSTDIRLSLALADTSVQIHGDQSITGTKTFSSNPILPISNNPVQEGLNRKAATEAQVFVSIRNADEVLHTAINAESNRAKGVEALKLNISDIVDTTTSFDANKALSANQGRILEGKFADKQNVISGTGAVETFLTTPIETGGIPRVVNSEYVMKSPNPYSGDDKLDIGIMVSTAKRDEATYIPLADLEHVDRKVSSINGLEPANWEDYYPTIQAVEDALNTQAGGLVNLQTDTRTYSEEETLASYSLAYTDADTYNTAIPKAIRETELWVDTASGTTNLTPAELVLQDAIIDNGITTGEGTVILSLNNKGIPIGGLQHTPRRQMIAANKEIAEKLSTQYPLAMVFYPED